MPATDPRPLQSCGRIFDLPVAGVQVGGEYRIVLLRHAFQRAQQLLAALSAADGELVYDERVDNLLRETVDALANLRDGAPQFRQMALEL